MMNNFMNPNQLILKIILGVQKDLKEKKELMPFFFIGVGDETHIIGTQFDGEESKDATVAFIKNFIKEKNADWVLFVAESWALRAKGKEAYEEYQKQRHKYKNLGEYPGSKDVVLFNLETRNDGKHMGYADILEKRKMGDINWQKDPRAVGRMTGFF